jgi:TetR/AcrR family transcriptional repressor of nem operon
MLGSWVDEADGDEAGGKAMAILSTMVGAVLLSRVVNDLALAQAFLHAATDQVREAVTA